MEGEHTVFLGGGDGEELLEDEEGEESAEDNEEHDGSTVVPGPGRTCEGQDHSEGHPDTGGEEETQPVDVS